MDLQMIIAVDGPAASGKGTIARRLAAHYALPYLDTGLLYRGVAHAMLQHGHDADDAAVAFALARDLDVEALDDEALRTAQVGAMASVVAAMPDVRAALLEVQKAFAAKPQGAVLDGRDIGTVICPHADVKLFVTASSEVRARRRFLELQKRGETIEESQVLADIQQRDERDRSRAAAPLVKAPDAVLLDTSNLDIENAFRAALAEVERVVLARTAKSR
jgi:cytidylate kinase